MSLRLATLDENRVLDFESFVFSVHSTYFHGRKEAMEALPVCHPRAVGITARALESSPDGKGGGAAITKRHEGLSVCCSRPRRALGRRAAQPEATKQPEQRDRNHSGTSPSSPPLGTIPEAAELVILEPVFKPGTRPHPPLCAPGTQNRPPPWYALSLDSGPSAPIGPFRPSRRQPSTPASAHRERLWAARRGPGRQRNSQVIRGMWMARHLVLGLARTPPAYRYAA